MNATTTKHGERFYTIGPIISRGHTDPAGRMLVAPDTVTLNFRSKDDPPGVNIDPVDLITALVDSLGDCPATEHLLNAVEALEGTTAAPAGPIGTPIARVTRKKPGPKPKVKAATEEEAA
jgi:hypothetical protein